MVGRIPCINPRCRRTIRDDGKSGEIICGKCFRCLPAAVRQEHRRLWRELKKWERRLTRATDDITANRIRRVCWRFSVLINRQWNSDIKPMFLAPEKPAGLASFLEEVGLA